ncbi:hypothetical protein UPYG_G00036880 [Umbra pygmaea]|uniref:DUF4590 domain-containing protein n=1 Tax=Umbra pygmaea TaxID=75934 RepID=A0ABD0XP75_UMBPY
MSHLNPGALSAYNSLTDKHLSGYFNNTRIRRHLQRVGLITRSGRIVPDKEYRLKVMQRAHQRHVRECLAQAVFHKVLDMEVRGEPKLPLDSDLGSVLHSSHQKKRLHQIEIKRKLEDFARRERVNKIKLDRSKRYEDEVIHILSPRPPTGPRSSHAQHSGLEAEHSESSESPGSSRPNTAPGTMQKPVRLKPIDRSRTTASHRRTFHYISQDSTNHPDQPFNFTMDKDHRRQLTVTEFSPGISPYRLPVINNFVTPVPPPLQRKERGGFKGTSNGTLRGRRFRPTTGMTEDSDSQRPSVQSKAVVSMVFFGKTVHLSHDLMDMRDEVKVFQQHCGGENLCVYKGHIQEGETFQFVSRRHRGFPFSLTFFLNGLQVERLSSCCEFKHRKGSRLGGRHGHFGFSNVEGASPCYRCIIAMGLDKKPTPPPKRIKEDMAVTSPRDIQELTADVEDIPGKDSPSPLEPESTQPQDLETAMNGNMASEEDKPKDDYDEDFEADEEGQAEDKQEDEGSRPASREKEDKDEGEKEDHSDIEDKDEEKKSLSRSGSISSGSEGDDSEADDEEDQTASQGPELHKHPEEDTPPMTELDCDTLTTNITIPPDPDQPTEDPTDMESCSPTTPQTTGTGEEDAGTVGDNVGGDTELEVSDTNGQSEKEGTGDEGLGEAEEEDKEGVAKVESSMEEEELERGKYALSCPEAVLPRAITRVTASCTPPTSLLGAFSTITEPSFSTV